MIVVMIIVGDQFDLKSCFSASQLPCNPSRGAVTAGRGDSQGVGWRDLGLFFHVFTLPGSLSPSPRLTFSVPNSIFEDSAEPSIEEEHGGCSRSGDILWISTISGVSYVSG